MVYHSERNGELGTGAVLGILLGDTDGNLDGDGLGFGDSVGPIQGESLS